MVSSLGFNSVYNYNGYSNSVQNRAVMGSPSIFGSQFGQMTNPIQANTSSNLIDAYMQTAGLYNLPSISSPNKCVSVPSGIGNYNNYTETDNYGNEVVSVKYSQIGNAIAQNLKTTSPDGTTLEKVTLNEDGKNSISLVVKDKSGRVLLDKTKVHEQLDSDSSRTTINGEVYNVSGLSGDVLKIEHNGEVRTIDLRAMTDEKVEKMTVTKNPDGYEDETFEDRPTKITEEERNILSSKIKSMGGDDLFRLTESVDELAYLDAPDGCPESFCNKRALILSKDAPNFVVSHELGHGVNHKNSQEVLLSDNDHIKNIRDYEIGNFKKNKQANDDRFYGKFADGNKLIQKENMSDKDAQSLLRDEIFAEAYAVLNTTEIVDFDELCYPRTLSLLKYCPRTIAQVETYSC